MILSLYVVLLIISLTFIILGLSKVEDYSYMALVGFVFLFLLSFVILNETLEYQTGANITSTYSYNINGSVNGTSQSVAYNQAVYSGSNAHTMGYYMIIISIVGFTGVLFSLTSVWKKKSKQRKEREEFD